METLQEFEHLLVQGVTVSKTVGRSDLARISSKLTPFSTEFPLVRLGGSGDGGYLILDDLAGVLACFSPGVATYARFEDDLLTRYGVNSHLADFSVDASPGDTNFLSFIKKFVGAYNDDEGKFLTLDRWCCSREEWWKPGDFILQMDIEGGEYETLLSTSDSTLTRFRSIVLELHNLDDWLNPSFFKVAESLIDKLLQHFVIVHLHPNNFGGVFKVFDYEFPKVIELTLHRRDRIFSMRPVDSLPHPLDTPNGPHEPDIGVPKQFFGR